MGARDSNAPPQRGADSMPPPRRTKTLRGVPGGDGEPPASDRPPGRRVTLDFRGPPLPLPGERSDGPGAPEASAPAAPPDPAMPEGAHDAWAHGRARRASTPSPTDGDGAAVRSPSYSDLPPPVALHLSTPVPDACVTPHPDDPPCGPEAIGLVDRSRSSLLPTDWASEMRELYALDDFTGALCAAELLLGRDPGHAEAQRYAESSRQRLEQIYSSRLGGLRAVPAVTVGASEVRWLGIDHRAGFLLSRIDGSASVEDILDMCSMPRLEALKLLSELLQAGALRVEDG